MAEHYRVIVSDAAYDAIIREAEYIVMDSGYQSRGDAWADRVFDLIETLNLYPERNPLAEEDSAVDYTVRKLNCDNHLILYAVDHEEAIVRILWCRHGSRKPRPDDLPPDPTQP